MEGAWRREEREGEGDAHGVGGGARLNVISRCSEA
jgi:hypothetical protein